MQKIVVISYSLRKNGNCDNVAKFIKSVLEKQSSRIDIVLFCMSDIQINNCGRCKYECFDRECYYNGDDICEIYQDILKSDMLISVLPIYGGLPSSQFFVFNERAQGALHDDEFTKIEKVKNKYIVIGNTGEEIARKIFRENDMQYEEGDVLMVKSNDVGERSVKGNLMEYAYYKDMIEEYLKELI